MALHELVRGDDVDVQRELLQAGLLEAALGLCEPSEPSEPGEGSEPGEQSEQGEPGERSERGSLADEVGGPATGRRAHRGGGRRVHLLVLRVLGAFTWRSHSAALRHEARPRRTLTPTQTIAKRTGGTHLSTLTLTLTPTPTLTLTRRGRDCAPSAHRASC